MRYRTFGAIDFEPSALGFGASLISIAAARSTSATGICRCGLIPSMPSLAIRENRSASGINVSRSRTTCSSTASPRISSGRPPYAFFHLARSVGWPNISHSMLSAVLPITD